MAVATVGRAAERRDAHARGAQRAVALVVGHALQGRLAAHLSVDAQDGVALAAGGTGVQAGDDRRVQRPGAAAEEALVEREHAKSVALGHGTTSGCHVEPRRCGGDDRTVTLL
jgi:hypothetical protein